MKNHLYLLSNKRRVYHCFEDMSVKLKIIEHVMGLKTFADQKSKRDLKNEISSS